MGIISSILDMLVGIVAWVFDGLFQAIKYCATSEHPPAYDATFANEANVLRSDKGFCLNGIKSLSIADSTKNALIIGSTGNFKSSGVLIPSLLRMRGGSSIVVTDFAGELLPLTSGAFIADGYEVLSVNYANPSEGYNPLVRAQSVSDIKKLSKIIITSALGNGGKDPFWNVSAEGLLGLVITYFRKHAPAEHLSLYNVYRLISAMSHSPDAIDGLFVKANDAELLNEYKSFLAYGDKTLSSVIATCRSALSIFGTDPQVALATSFDTLNFQEFRSKKKILYINTSTTDMRYYSLINSLLLDQLFAEIMRTLPSPSDFSIFTLIDEASSLVFNNLQITVANIRKFKAGILQVYQSAAQLTDLYGLAVSKAITENSYARLYMPGQPLSVASELESILGKTEFQDETNIRRVQPLMTADQIIHAKESILLCGTNRAVKTTVVPYFKQPKLLSLTQLPPYQPVYKLPYTKPPQFDFNQ